MWTDFISKYLSFSRACVTDGVLNMTGERVERLLTNSGMTMEQAKADVKSFADKTKLRSLPLYAQADKYVGWLEKKTDATTEDGPILKPGYYVAKHRKWGRVVYAIYETCDDGVLGYYNVDDGFPGAYSNWFARRTNKYNRGGSTTGMLRPAEPREIELWKETRDRLSPRLRGPDEPPSEEERAELGRVMRQLGPKVRVTEGGEPAEDDFGPGSPLPF